MRRLVENNPNIARRIYESIKRAIENMKAYFGNKNSREYLELVRGRELFEKALESKGVNGNAAAQYTIRQTISGVPYVEIDKKTGDGKLISETEKGLRPQIVKDIINAMDGMTIPTVEGDIVSITGEKTSYNGEKERSTAGKMTSWDRFYDEDTYYNDKLPLAAQIDEITKVSYIGDRAAKPDLSSKHDEFAANGWHYRTAFVKYGDEWLKLRMSVAKGMNQNTIYNIGQILGVSNKYVDKQKTPFTKNDGALQKQSPANDVSKNKISQRKQIVNKNTDSTKTAMEIALEEAQQKNNDKRQYSIKDEETDRFVRQFADAAQAIEKNTRGNGNTFS